MSSGLETADRKRVMAVLTWALQKREELLAERGYVEASLAQEGYPTEDIELAEFLPEPPSGG